MSEPVQIKLKRKYLAGFRSAQKSGSNRSGNGKRHKITAGAKKMLKEQPKMIMHVYPGGRARMERVA